MDFYAKEIFDDLRGMKKGHSYETMPLCGEMENDDCDYFLRLMSNASPPSPRRAEVVGSGMGAVVMLKVNSMSEPLTILGPDVSLSPFSSTVRVPV